MYELALILSVVCLIVVSIMFVYDRSFSVYHPLTMYIGFHALIFVIRPIVAWTNNFQYIYSAYQFSPSYSDKITVILASNLGFLCFAAFSMYYGRIEMRFKLDAATQIERQNLKKLFPWVLAICVPIGSYSLLKSFGNSSMGTSNATLVLDSGTGTFLNTTGNGYLFEAQLMLATCGAILAWLYRFKFVALLPLLTFVFLRAGTGGRWPFVVALSAVGLLYLYEKKLKFSGIRLTAVVVVIAIAFSAIGADRGQAIRKLVGTDNTREISSGRDLKFMEGMDLGNLEYFEYLVYAIPAKTHTYGYFIDTLQVFTEPVPRILWKGKPVGPPFNNIFLFNYGHPIGMTRSMPGQGWYSLGWLGVIVWCSLWGLCLGWIYRKFVVSAQSAFQTAMYMVFLTSLIATFRDGLLTTLFRYDLFFLLPIVVWYYISKMAGYPSIVDLRRRLSKRLESMGDAVAPKSSRDTSLPLAVQRRRAALAKNGTQNP